MRIIIETNAQEVVSVSQGEEAGRPEALETIDGGQPPPELLQALSGEVEEAAEEVMVSEPKEFEDAGEAPTWLVDVIEGAGAAEPENSAGA